MGEGSLYDRELAALAIKQAQGDLVEAAFLLRAYRTTLPRFGCIAAGGDRAHEDAPPHLRDLQGPAGRTGAGPDLRLHPPPARFRAAVAGAPPRAAPKRQPNAADVPRVFGILGREDLIERDPPGTDAGAWRPHPRAARLPGRARSCGCRPWRAATRASCWRSATRRSAARAAPTPSSARSGSARCDVEFAPPELGFAIEHRRHRC